MNPDFKSYDTSNSTTWRIIKGNQTVSFKKYRDNIVVRDNGTNKSYSIEMARKKWDEYMRKGFHIINECVDHDMNKFHDAYREIEYNIPHEAELKEARINPKKFYTDNWEYALRA